MKNTETYQTTVEHLSKELGVSYAHAMGFIKTMEACFMAKPVGFQKTPEDVKKKGKRAAIYEIQKNVEVFVEDVNPEMQISVDVSEVKEEKEVTEEVEEEKES